MNAEQFAHLRRILHECSADLTHKYEAGQREHGGNLWEKSGLLDEAIKEAIDQVIYLYTLRERARKRGIEL